ncbi:hypothetical protein A2856_01220 [Candidatus Uhrbacteria bacterium RIFCSPHIGHO2_01_FULL_63_20]|uniref:Uncharacterized protein n=1 Tax=Candidatus Uhrbacteria bacterium RIFCSPHIGHO2_01_FULL_63_20 TaxID=1802385 RepID=A0A1F7TMR6_9BACT|nr:MAG: hypothetical protein A2856_01220 [Candidatus Uhrbacteria bacterium RIFCSPHIGHO2_01_FULL_63_20]
MISKKQLLASILGASMFLGAGCAPASPAVTDVPDMTTAWETQERPPAQTGPDTLQFSPAVTAKIPAGWTVQAYVPVPQYTNYDVTTSVSQNVGLGAIHVSEWLKGPSPDEGYVIAHEDRPAALEVLKGAYEHKAVTAADRANFEAGVGEFLGYSQVRASLQYFASADGTFRGISFYNLQGQAAGAYPVYHVSLYDPTSDMIVYGWYGVPASAKEVVGINAWLEDMNGLSSKEIQTRDEQGKVKVKALLESTPKSKLSFFAGLNLFDEFFRSISRK